MMEAVGSGEQQEPRKRLRCITVYMSPLCPDLRTRVWLQFVGFPRHLWNETNATGCLARFGGVTHLDAAELRRSGRMVAEARVTRLAEVPKWVLVMEDVGGGHGIGHCVPLVILSAEPVFADEEISESSAPAAAEERPSPGVRQVLPFEHVLVRKERNATQCSRPVSSGGLPSD